MVEMSQRRDLEELINQGFVGLGKSCRSIASGGPEVRYQKQSPTLFPASAQFVLL